MAHEAGDFLITYLLTNNKKMNLFELLSTFKSEEDFLLFLTKRRWSGGVRCSFCACRHVSNRKNAHRYKCHECNRSFSVTSGTLMHATKLPLSKWFLAISIISNAKKGLSSLQLARDLGVNKNTAWYLQMRIRAAMHEDSTLGGLLLPLKSRSRSLKKKDSNLFHRENPMYGLIKKKALTIVGKKSRSNEVIYVNVHADKIKTRTQMLLARALTGQFHRLNLTYLSKYIHEIEVKSHHQPNDLFCLLLGRCAGLSATW